MKKTTKKKVKASPVLLEGEIFAQIVVPERTVINPLSIEFGREDLNSLRDKVNEICVLLNTRL